MILFIIIALIVGVVLIGVGLFFSSEEGRTWPFFAGVGLWLALTAFFWYASWGTKTTETILVERTERIAEGNDGKWVVYEQDGETFENTDAWFQGKTDSTDLQRELLAGHTYECEVNGWRITLLSSYRNVLRCHEVDAP